LTKDALNCLKVTVNMFIMLQTLSISNKYCSFELSVHQIILKKIVYTTVLNTDKNNMFLEQHISILEWFLKDHATLKTGVPIQFCN